MPRQKTRAQKAQQTPTEPSCEIVLDEATGNRIFHTRLTYPSGDPINLYIVDTFYGSVLTDGGETARQLGRHMIHGEKCLDLRQIKLWMQIHIDHRLRSDRHVKLDDLGSERIEVNADDLADALRRVLGAIVDVIEAETLIDAQAQKSDSAR